MSSENLTGLYSSDREHEHLLDSDRFGWDKLGLIYELLPIFCQSTRVILQNDLRLLYIKDVENSIAYFKMNYYPVFQITALKIKLELLCDYKYGYKYRQQNIYKTAGT